MNPEVMATRIGTTKPEHVATALLEQLVDLDARSISPETALKILGLFFDSLHHHRVDSLSEKAREGSLTPIEQDEPDEYNRVADAPAILQSRVRQALKL